MNAKTDNNNNGAALPLLKILLGPLAAALVYSLVPEQTVGLDNEVLTLGTPGKVTAGLATWMAVWWLTEAIPVYATALLPIAVLPTSGVQSIKDTAASFAHPVLFLFTGGFILALALERWQLHRRFAVGIIGVIGTRPAFIIGGFMFVSASLSMWITNTATTMVMLPVALSIIALHPEDDSKRNFGLCLLLGIAYSASIGGIGTLIGTVPNMFTASFMQDQLNVQISFTRWMMIGVPVVVIFVPVVWLVLTQLVYPPGDHRISSEQLNTQLAPWTRGARLTLVIFLLTAAAWICRSLLNKLPGLGGLTDEGIAIIAALLLFAVPANLKKRQFLVDWQTVERLPWGVLLLLGGGIALAAAVGKFGVGELLAGQLTQFRDVPPLLMTAIIVALIIFLTEITSNTATTTSLIPIFSAMAIGMGLNPLSVIIPATIAASCAFMLPVATPPNAIVFGSKLISIPQMARAGLWLNLAGVLIVSLLSLYLEPLLKP